MPPADEPPRDVTLRRTTPPVITTRRETSTVTTVYGLALIPCPERECRLPPAVHTPGRANGRDRRKIGLVRDIQVGLQMHFLRAAAARINYGNSVCLSVTTRNGFNAR